MTNSTLRIRRHFLLFRMLLVALSFVSSAARRADAATFTPLGLFGGAGSAAYDLSGDGSVVVGAVFDDRGNPSAVFRWTASGTVFGPPNTPFTFPAISPDGSVIVGQYISSNGPEAFRWPVGATAQGLGDFPGGVFASGASDASADGSVIVGFGSPTANEEASRWSPGIEGLGTLAGATRSIAVGVSANGNVIVGDSVGGQAFRWTAQTGSVGIAQGASSSARRVSSDGSIIVGTRALPPPPGGINPQREAFRWTQPTGIVGLGDLPGARIYSEGHDVSADGSVIVGTGETTGPNGAAFAPFYWTQNTGMLNLRDVLISAGVTNLQGWTLVEAYGVSADGRTIVGYGAHDGRSEAWIATIPEPSTIVLAAIAAAGLLAVWRRNHNLSADAP